MKKKVLSLLLAVVMTFSLAVTANAAEETAQDLDGDIVILHTNDVHGAISGYAKVAALKDAYEARGAYVLLMDAGDFIQGDPTVSTSEGATAVELMNLAGYDVASMGNHEFDYGYQNLKDLEADADFTIVDANVLYNGQVAFEDNVVFTAPDGTKIGVFGLDTPETATKAHPAKIQGVTFLAGDKMFDCAQDQVDALEAEGCEYIICLGHLGIDAESTGNRSIDLLEKVDGIDVREMAKKDLLSHIALVSQYPVLFRGSVADNIRIGRPDASDAEVEEAGRMSAVDSFINETGEGYSRMIGEMGEGLSGGQRQRVSLARAFLKNAPILVLDEATASLDMKSEELIQKEIEKLASGRTAFIIAHRFSTIRMADRILVLEKGSVIADGTHEELMASSPLYRELYNKQQMVAEEEGGASC